MPGEGGDDVHSGMDARRVKAAKVRSCGALTIRHATTNGTALDHAGPLLSATLFKTDMKYIGYVLLGMAVPDSRLRAKEEKGVSIGISPAANEREHINTYRLPLDYMDLIIYTGFGFSGRDLLFTRSCDAIIIGCGRIGTLHEFTIAFEDGKPIGVLEGEWTMSETIKEVIARANRPNNKIVFSKDPKELIQKVIALVMKDKEDDSTKKEK